MGNRVVKGEKLVNCLLVEGNDKHVFWSLLEHYKFPEVFHIKEKGSCLD